MMMAIVVPAIAIVGYLTYHAIRAGYPWSDRDWNGDGRTSLLEYLEAVDVGVRTVAVHGIACTEYFRLKDGLRIRLRCSDPGRQR
jgi:hypothetical protein